MDGFPSTNDLFIIIGIFCLLFLFYMLNLTSNVHIVTIVILILKLSDIINK